MQHPGGSSIIVAVAIVGLGLSAGTAFGQTWSFDATSPLNLDANAFADEWSVPGGVTAADTTTVFVADYTSDGGIDYDWGNGVNPVAIDQPNPPYAPVVESSAAGMVGIRGLGTNSLNIRWKATTTLSSLAESFDGWADALASSTVLAGIDGLNPGDPYTLIYDWELFAQAQVFHEGAGEDPEYAAGSLAFDFGGLGPGDVFNEQVDGDDPNLPSLLDENGGGQIDFVPGDTSLLLSADVYAYAWAQFTHPAYDDLAVSEFAGELTLTVVPEPGMAVLLVMSGLLLIRRRR
jgi:hypothetical protein